MDQLPIERLVETGHLVLVMKCPQCGLLVKYGAEKCESCRAALPRSPSAAEIFIGVRGGSSPHEWPTPFVECPNCRKLLKLGTEICPECREEIDPDYAVRSAAARVLTAQASTAADAIESTKVIAALIALLSAGMFALDKSSFGRPAIFYLTLFPSVTYTLWALGWMRRYGWLPLRDEDYLSAKRKVKPALLAWLGLLAAQFLALGLWLSGLL